MAVLRQRFVLSALWRSDWERIPMSMTDEHLQALAARCKRKAEHIRLWGDNSPITQFTADEYDAITDALTALRAEREGEIANLIAVLDNVSMCARRALSYGHQATPHTDARLVEVKEAMLRDIVQFCEKAGIHGTLLRAANERAESAEAALAALRARVRAFIVAYDRDCQKDDGYWSPVVNAICALRAAVAPPEETPPLKRPAEERVDRADYHHGR
jgi:hypothetical protein